MSYMIHIYKVNEELHEEFIQLLIDNDFKQRGQQCRTRYIQAAIYELGLRAFLLDPESILTVYKECISEIKDIPQKNTEGLNNLQKINIVSDYLTSIGIRSGKDIVKLYTKASYINFWLGTIIITLIFAAALSTPAMEIFDMLLKKIDPSGSSFPFQFLLLSTYFILMIFRIPPFVKNSTKRKILVATINIFERSLNIKPDVMRVFFKNKYMFEYKRLKRW